MIEFVNVHNIRSAENWNHDNKKVNNTYFFTVPLILNDGIIPSERAVEEKYSLYVPDDFV